MLSLVETKRPRVLIVDDSPYNIFVMRELITLISGSIQICQALNGKEAVDIVTASPPFDIIFLDIHMPVMDGYQAATTLHEYDDSGLINL